MSTPMTPAQAAQNQNRTGGGQYKEKSYSEAEIALNPAGPTDEQLTQRIAATPPRYDSRGREDVSAIVATQAVRATMPEQSGHLETIIEDSAAGAREMDTALDLEDGRYLDVADCASRDADGTWRISYHSGGYGEDWSDTQVTWSARDGFKDTGAGDQDRLKHESYGFAGGQGDFMQAAYGAAPGQEEQVFEAMEARYQQVRAARDAAGTWGELSQEDEDLRVQGFEIAAEVARDKLNDSDWGDDYEGEDRAELERTLEISQQEPATVDRDSTQMMLAEAAAELRDRGGKERAQDYDWKDRAQFNDQARKVEALRSKLFLRP